MIYTNVRRYHSCVFGLLKLFLRLYTVGKKSTMPFNPLACGCIFSLSSVGVNSLRKIRRSVQRVLSSFCTTVQRMVTVPTFYLMANIAFSKTQVTAGKVSTHVYQYTVYMMYTGSYLIWHKTLKIISDMMSWLYPEPVSFLWQTIFKESMMPFYII